MQTLKQIRRRIRSVENTQQITKVMEMVSASKLVRMQIQLESTKPYYERIRAILQRILSNTFESSSHTQEETPIENPFIKLREVKNRALMVVTSDRGLCGAYNTNVIQQAENAIKKYDRKTWKLICVGKKGRDYFAKKGWAIVHSIVDTGGRLDAQICRGLAQYIADAYISSEFDEVFFAYTSFKSVTNITPTVTKFLNITPSSLGAEVESTGYAPSNYIYEPDMKSVLDRLIPDYIYTKLFITITEAYTSEHGARMIAMRTATDNAKDMIENLTLVMNKARQASITKEISEIVGTAEAIK